MFQGYLSLNYITTCDPFYDDLFGRHLENRVLPKGTSHVFIDFAKYTR